MPRLASAITVLGLLLTLSPVTPGLAQDGPTGSAGPAPAPVEAQPSGPPPPPPSAEGWQPGPCPKVPPGVLITDVRLDLRDRRDTVLVIRTSQTVRLTSTVGGERSTVRRIRRCRVSRIHLGRQHGTMTVRATAGDVIDRRRFPF